MPVTDFEAIRQQLTTSDLDLIAVNRTFIGLRSRYNEPWRYYHNFEHIQELFDLLRAHIDEVKDPQKIGWTILYHDAVYDPKAESGRNEELSAQLAESELTKLGCQRLGETVARYTRTTAQHDTDGTDSDLDFFLDADLAVLGSPAARYERYAADIRREYGHVEASQYRLGRIAVLNGLVKRVEKAGLFRTELFRATYEAQAQQNIANEVSRLQGADL